MNKMVLGGVLMNNYKKRIVDEVLQTKLIEEGTKDLIALANLIDTSKMKKPSFLMVVTATSDYAYKREDGVYVVPIGCLGCVKKNV